MSFNVDEDDDGVSTGDWLDESRDEGDEVPSLESLFFLEDLPASLPRESCTWQRKPYQWAIRGWGPGSGGAQSMRGQARLTTL